MFRKLDLDIIKKISSVVFLSTLTTSVNADVIFEQSGSIRLGTTYHSNLLFLPDEFKESVLLYQLRPQYKLSALDERNTWFATAGLQIERSSDENVAQDVENPFATLGWTHDLSLGTLSLQADYVKQRIAISQFGVTDTVTINGTSTTKNLNLGWSYQFLPKLLLSTNLLYSKSDFSGTDDLVGFSTKSGQVRLDYLYNETITPYVTAQAFDFKTDDGNARINQWQQYLLGTKFELSPKFNVDINAGVTKFNGDVSNAFITSSTLNYTNARHTLIGKLSRAVVPTGLRQTNISDAIDGSYSYELSPLSTVAFNGNYTEIDNDFTVVDTYNISASYSRSLTPTWLINIILSQRNIDDSVNEFEDNALSLNLIYTSPNF